MYFFSLLTVLIVCLLIRWSVPMWRGCERRPLAYYSNEVYCLMVTSNTAHRRPYCRLSVRNFFEQSYPTKRLIIVNLSDSPILTEQERTDDRVLEVRVKRNGLSLGAIRNVSLEFVPPHAWWTLWDDDDWRSRDYLERLRSWSQGYDFLMIQNRIEYNTTNGFAYVLTLRSGLMSFFAKRLPELRYDDLDRKEDVLVKRTAEATLRCKAIDNPAEMYIRMVHGMNTSPYVNNSKDTLRDTSHHKEYFERSLSEQESLYMRKILSSKYKHVAPLRGPLR